MNEATQKIFIVTEGEYSDYSIVGVFSSEEKANWYIGEADDGTETFQVETYAVDAILKRVLHHYRVDMVIESRSAKAYLKDDNDYEPGRCVDTEPLIYDSQMIRWYSIIAKSKDHAIKKANEKLSALLAANRLRPVERKSKCWELTKADGEVVIAG